MNKLKDLDKKIALAVEKVKTLKEDKSALERRVHELESMLNEKNAELDELNSDRTSIRGQINDLLSELEAIEAE